MKTTTSPKAQKGSALLEALFAMLIFSIGILALVGLQAVSIKNSIDAKHRSEASYMANRIIAQMWVDRSNLNAYAHNETGTTCSFTGSSSANANVAGWVTQVAGVLPGTASNKTQIQVTAPSADTRQVKVTVCWQSPREIAAGTFHNFATTAQINQI